MNPMDPPTQRTLIPEADSGDGPKPVPSRPPLAFSDELLDAPEPVALRLRQSGVIPANSQVSVITDTPPPVRTRGPTPKLRQASTISERPPPVRVHAPGVKVQPEATAPRKPPPLERNVSNPRLDLGEIKDLLTPPSDEEAEVGMDALFERWSTMEPTLGREHEPEEPVENPPSRALAAGLVVLAFAVLVVLPAGLLAVGNQLRGAASSSDEMATQIVVEEATPAVQALPGSADEPPPVEVEPAAAPEPSPVDVEPAAAPDGLEARGTAEEDSAPARTPEVAPASKPVVRPAPKPTRPVAARPSPRPRPRPVAVQPAPKPRPVAVQPAPKPRPVAVQPAPTPQPVALTPPPQPPASAPAPTAADTWAEVLSSPPAAPQPAPTAEEGEKIVWAPWGTEAVGTDSE